MQAELEHWGDQRNTPRGWQRLDEAHIWALHFLLRMLGVIWDCPGSEAVRFCSCLQQPNLTSPKKDIDFPCTLHRLWNFAGIISLASDNLLVDSNQSS
jgi:hypothetical protein